MLDKFSADNVTFDQQPMILQEPEIGLCVSIGCFLKYLLQAAAAAAAAAKSLQSCPTLCNTIDSSPPGSPVPGIL